MQKIQSYVYIYINTIHKIQKIQNSEKNIKFKNKKNIESRKFTVENPKKSRKFRKT